MPQSKCQNLTCNQRDPHTVGSRSRSRSRLEDPGAVLVCPPGPGVRHAAGRQADWAEQVSGDPAQVPPGSRGDRGVSLQRVRFQHTLRSELDFLLYTMYMYTHTVHHKGGNEVTGTNMTPCHCDVTETGRRQQEVHCHLSSSCRDTRPVFFAPIRVCIVATFVDASNINQA